jgi:hypothetical protein
MSGTKETADLRAAVSKRLSDSVEHHWDLVCDTSVATLDTTLAEILDRMRDDPHGWVLVVDHPGPPNRYVQVLAPPGGGLIAECVSNEYLKGDERQSVEDEEVLPTLGWDWPSPPQKRNWTFHDEVLDSGSAIGMLLMKTIRGVFGLADDDIVTLKVFPSKVQRGDSGNESFTTSREPTPQELAAVRSWSNVGAPGPPPNEPLVPDAEELQRLTLIQLPRSIPVRWRLTPEQFRRLKHGHHAEAMEDKWNIYMDEGVVHFHRSWTGMETYRLQVDKAAHGWVVNELIVEQDPDKFHATDRDEIESSFREVLGAVLGVTPKDRDAPDVDADLMVRLRAERKGGDSRFLRAYLEPDGSLLLEGQDLGPSTAPVSPDGEYEWYQRIKAEDFPRLLELLGAAAESDILDVLAEHWTGMASYDLEKKLRQSTIPVELFVC